MECSCVMVNDLLESGPEFLLERMVKARKVAVCSECRGVINPGEQYEKTTGKWDGDVQTFKTCLDCLSVRDSFFCGGYIFSEVWVNLEEHIIEMSGEVSEECLRSLTVKAREKVCDLIESNWENNE